MITKVYAHFLLRVNSSGSPVYINGVGTIDVDFGNQPLQLRASNAIDPHFVGMMQSALRITFNTTNSAALSAIGIDGRAIDSAANTDVRIYYRRFQQGGMFMSGTSHDYIDIKKGIILPPGIDAPNGGNIALSYQIIPVWNGTDNPATESTGVAVAGALTNYTPFVGGPVKLQGSFLETQGWSLAAPATPITLSGDGDLFESFCAIQSRQWMFNIRSADMSKLNTFGLHGVALSSDALFYGRKMAQGAGRTADATAEHLLLTVNDGMLFPGSLSSGGVADAGFTVIARDNLSDPVIAISTSSAIA